MKLSLAIQTPEIREIIPVALLSGSLEEKLSKAAAFDANGVELMVADPASLDAEAIRSAVQSNGLCVSAIGSGAVAFAHGLTLLHSDPDKAERARARLGDLITFARRLGAPLVTIGSFRGRLANVGPSGRERFAALMRQAAASAEAQGVRLVLEPLNRYESDLVNTVQEALALLSEIDHPALGLVVDTFHVNIEERSWTEPFREAAAAGRLWHVHLGDNNRLPPGRGLIDFGAIVGALRDVGYAGFLSAELLARPDADTAARETLDHMHMLL